MRTRYGSGFGRLGRVLALALVAVIGFSAQAAMVLSDGSDGAWSGGGSLALDDDGIFNFTTIDIPTGSTLSFSKNAANTPVVLAATGDVTIDGTVTVSAGHFSRTASGPGGGSGGTKGSGAQAGTAGTGPSPGAGGEFPLTAKPGNAGGGGGMASEGLTAVHYTNTAPGAGGAAIGFSGPVGGSGGGGGSGWIFFGVQLEGGDGGAGGGGIYIATPGRIEVNGSILANGGHGGWAFANIGGYGGPGGGGSGGNIVLEGADITLGSAALISAIGGAGGGLSTQPVPNDPFGYSSGAHGGLGYAAFRTANLNIAAGATLDAAVVPLPPALWLLLSATVGLAVLARGPAQARG